MRPLRIGICALVVFGVLSHGAVEDWARAVMETGAGVLFVAWAVRAHLLDHKQAEISPLLPPLIVFAFIALGQLVFRGTILPYYTRQELQLLVAYILVLFVAGQVFHTTQDWRSLVWFVMSFGFAVAVFGILQHLTFNGKLYWFREMRFGGIPFGPYVNRNHFAGLMELIIPIPLVPLILGKVRRERWLAVGIMAILPIGALLLSASRGGIVSFGVELVILAVLMSMRRMAARHVLSGAAILLVAFAMVSWIGVGQILERFATMQSLEVTSGMRAAMRADTWQIFREHPWAGTGLGTLQIVFPAYETLYDARFITHSHNDYLETLSDTGILGGLCCGWFLATLFFKSLKQLFWRDKSFAAALHLAGLVGCCGFLIHSLVDFNLHIPGNALVFFLTAYLATSNIGERGQNDRSRSEREITD